MQSFISSIYEQLFKQEVQLIKNKNKRKKLQMQAHGFEQSNPHGNLSIDFWVYRVHLNVPWHPCQHPHDI